MEKLNNYLGVDMVQFTEYNNVSKKPETKSYQMNEKAKKIRSRPKKRTKA